MRYLINILIIHMAKIARIIKLIIINITIIVLLTVFLVPYLQKFIYLISEIEINNSIINTFFGAMIGINFSAVISKKNDLKDYLKKYREPVYFNYLNSLNRAINCLEDSSKYRYFFLNKKNIITIYNIHDNDLPMILKAPLNRDKYNIKQLYFHLDESLKTIKNGIKHFFELDENTIIKHEDNIFSILDILLADYEAEEKNRLINIHFDEFRNKDSTKVISANNFICWALNYDSINKLNYLCIKSLKLFKKHNEILEYNSNYINKRIYSYDLKEV